MAFVLSKRVLENDKSLLALVHGPNRKACHFPLEHSPSPLIDENILTIIIIQDLLYPKVQSAFGQLDYPSTSAMNNLPFSPSLSRSALMTTFQ